MPSLREFWKEEAAPGKDSVLWPEGSCSPRGTSKAAAPHCSCSAGKELHTQTRLSTGPQPRGQLSAAGVRWYLWESRAPGLVPGALGMGWWLLLPGILHCRSTRQFITVHTRQKQAGDRALEMQFYTYCCNNYPSSWKCDFSPSSPPSVILQHSNRACRVGKQRLPLTGASMAAKHFGGGSQGVNKGEKERCQGLTPRCPVAPWGWVLPWQLQPRLLGAHPCPGTGADIGSLPVLG